MIDFIIVGSGLAGISFAEIAIQHNKSIVVFDNHSQPSSKVAGGLYNPVVLKRFSEIWKAKEQVDFSFPFYRNLEEKLNVKFDFPMQLFRKFASIEEQNNWFAAADKHSLKEFLSSSIQHTTFNGINSNFGFGEVFNTGYLEIKDLIYSFTSYLKLKNCFLEESFDYSKIIFHQDYIEYNDIKAKKLIFAEGFGLHSNPFFSNLPLDGTKGELLIIKAPDLKLNVIVKSKVFILPIGNDLYKVGATYNWEDKTNNPTDDAKNELVSNLKELIHCDFEIVNHLAGVRPTVKDRRPLVGQHYKYENLFVLNGLGTRGVMLAPFLANQLFNFINENIPLDREIDVKRIYKKLNLN